MTISLTDIIEHRNASNLFQLAPGLADLLLSSSDESIIMSRQSNKRSKRGKKDESSDEEDEEDEDQEEDGDDVAELAPVVIETATTRRNQSRSSKQKAMSLLSSQAAAETVRDEDAENKTFNAQAV